MFKGYNLSISGDFFWEERVCLNNWREEEANITNKKENIKREVNGVFKKIDEIDVEKLKNIWFPNEGEKHVFISHSHQDLELVTDLAVWLKCRFNIDSFIDSYVWGYVDDLKVKIKNQYLKDHKEDIDDSILASNLNVILSNALHNVMDNCECLLFVNTENSMSIDSKTYSPWIFSEIATSAMLAPKLNKNRSIELNEASMEGFKSYKFSFDLDLRHLNKLDKDGLEKWKQLSRYSEGYDALTRLYEKL